MLRNPLNTSSLFASPVLDLFAYTDDSVESIPDELIINTKQKADKAIKFIRGNPLIVFDTETDSLDFLKQTLLGFSFGNGEKGFYVPTLHNYYSVLDHRYALDILYELRKVKLLIGHNLTFDLSIYCRIFETSEILREFNQFYDTYWAAFYLQQERPGGNGLKNLTRSLLKREVTEFSDLLEGGLDLASVDMNLIAKYAIDDVKNPYDLYLNFVKDQKELGYYQQFLGIKMKLLNVLVRMKIRGLKIDTDFLNKKDVEITNTIEDLTSKMLKICPTLDPSKDQQVAEFLFGPTCDGNLEIPMHKPRTKDGSYDMTEEHLDAIKGHHPLVPLLLDYNKLSVDKATFINGIKSYLSENATIHPEYKGAGVRTGRLATATPNVMNWPSTGDIRNAIIPHRKKLFSADYSQIELRLLAHFTEEDSLVQAFKEDLDPHYINCGNMELLTHRLIIERLGELHTPPKNEEQLRRRKLFYAHPIIIDREVSAGKSKSEVTDHILTEILGKNYYDALPELKEKRTQVKGITYGILYGATVKRLSTMPGFVGKSNDEIQLIHDRFMKALPKTKRFMEETHAFIKAHNYVTTVANFRRVLSPKGHSEEDIASICRQGFNAKLQGSAADIVSYAMVKLETTQELKDYHILLQVHDEILIDLPNDYEDSKIELICSIMRNPFSPMTYPLKVPLGIDWKLLPKWTK